MKQDTRSLRPMVECKGIYTMTKTCTSIYLGFLFLVFPLYYQNNYINILESKTFLFSIVTIVYFIAMLICFWIESIKAYEDEQRKGRKGKKQSVNRAEKNDKTTSWINIWFLVFLGVLCVSTIATGSISDAWYGMDTKMFGTKILLLCCGIFVFVSKGYKLTKVIHGCLILGTGIVYILTILNRFQIDPLHMYSNLIQEQHSIYLSTIGNVNILSSYISVLLPLCMGLFLYTESAMSKGYKLSYGVLIVLGVMAGISTNSDSFFLGFGAALGTFLWFALSGQKESKEYLKLCILCGISMLILHGFYNWTDKPVIWKTLQLTMIEEIPWLLIIAVLILLYCATTKVSAESVYHKVRNIIFLILAICIIGLVVYIVLINLGAIETDNSYLIFNDKWGTNRGYAWRNTIELYGELPLYQKIIGIGPGQFYDFFAVPNEIRERPFVDPHSDYLYYLVTFGVVGFASWLGMILTAIVTCLRNRDAEAVIIASLLIAWMAQATVNTSLVFTVPYLFVMLALARRKE